MLEESIRKYQNRAIETAQIIEELIQLAKDMRKAAQRVAKHLGRAKTKLPISTTRWKPTTAPSKSSATKNLKFIAQELVKTIRENVTIDWTTRRIRPRQAARHG